MLEQMYYDQSQEAVDDQGQLRPRNSKRRKTTSKVTATAAQDIDDEDDVYYASVQSKKGKGGVGYAGDQREDVRASISVCNHSISINFRILGN
jgi:hypothetical protein